MSVAEFSWGGGRVRKRKTRPKKNKDEIRGTAVAREVEWVPSQCVQYHTEP